MARPNPLPSDASPAARVGELHNMVREARRRLTAPNVESLDACRSLIEEAVHAMEAFRNSLPSADPWRDDIARSLGTLRTEIAGVRILLDSAEAFYTGWTRLASSMASGYLADGNPAPAETAPRVLLEV